VPLGQWRTASLNVGGNGGTSDNGAAVTITQGASGAAITTTGNESSGIYAQSIGGGGGRGGVGALALSLTVGLGGSGGENGTAAP
jgi:hypothetical protein